MIFDFESHLTYEGVIVFPIFPFNNPEPTVPPDVTPITGTDNPIQIIQGSL